VADKLRQWLDEVRALQGDPRSPATVAALRQVLAKRPGAVVAPTAWHAAEHQLAELRPDLAAAYERLAGGGVKADPGCSGKLAVLEALSAFDHRDPDPFLHWCSSRRAGDRRSTPR
jgi:hypothetical protein